MINKTIGSDALNCKGFRPEKTPAWGAAANGWSAIKVKKKGKVKRKEKKKGKLKKTGKTALFFFREVPPEES